MNQKKKKLIFNFRPSTKARFVLERIGFVDKIGRARTTHGSLTDFINQCITQPFEGKDILEIEWPRFQQNQICREISEKKKKVASLGLIIDKIESARELIKQQQKDLIDRKT